MKKILLTLVICIICLILLLPFTTISPSEITYNKTLSMKNLYETKNRLNLSQKKFWFQVLKFHKMGSRKKIRIRMHMKITDLMDLVYNPHILPNCYYSDNISHLPGISFLTNLIIVDMKKVSSVINNSKSNELKLKKIIHSLNLTKNSTEQEAIKKINSYICQKVEYDFSGKNSTLSTALMGKTTCLGYSLEFVALCKMVGIKAKVVYGSMNISNHWKAHAWNTVYVNHEIKHIDVCSNDATNSSDYLLISFSEISKIYRQKKTWFKTDITKLKYF